jgi:hypothetical protein
MEIAHDRERKGHCILPGDQHGLRRMFSRIHVVPGIMTRALVFGGRDYRDRRCLFDVLDDLHDYHEITCIIEGEAAGADRLSRQWAESRNVPFDPYPAGWDDIDRPGALVRRNRSGKLYDAAAGPFRNEKMLREGRPDIAIGFPGGSGTRDMTIRCLEYGILPILIRL